MIKNLPSEITSYDLIKTLAVIFMIVDHLGYYVFYDETWMRVMGRLSVPIWFFLIGFARARDISLKVMIAFGALVGLSVLAGESIFPINILFTLMLGRLFIDMFMRAVRRGGEALAGIFFMLCLAIFPSVLFFEYGTLGLLFTVWGGYCRHRLDTEQETNRILGKQMALFSLGVLFLFALIQGASIPSLSYLQFFILLLGFFGIWFVLKEFKPQTMVNFTKILPRSGVATLHFCGRRTLEIYVAHLFVLKIYAMYFRSDDFKFMEWRWIDHEAWATIQLIFGTV